MEQNRTTVEVIQNNTTTADQPAEPSLSESNHPRSRRRTFRKILKDDSSLSLLKIAATTLTAVSMAIISTKLTTIVNSFVLIALVSIGTAIVSEFYRVILSVTSLGAKKVIAPIIQINPDGTTSEIPIVTPAQVAEANRNADRLIGAVENPSLIAKIKRYFRKNPIVRMALLFTLVAAITITTNYFISGSSDKVESVNNYTTVQNPVQNLSDTEKQEIVDIASSSANSNSDQQKNELQTKIDDLIAKNGELKSEIANLENKQVESALGVAELEKRLKEIEETLSKSPSNAIEPDPVIPAPTPSTSPTPSETSTIIPDPVERPAASTEKNIPTAS